MRVALDATPLLGTPTGVGRYVGGLVDALIRLPERPELTLAAFTWRGAKDVPAPPGVRVAGRRAPARLLQQLWSRLDVPPVEWLTGPADVVHGTNFVLPPRRRAAGVVTVHDLAYLHDVETVTPQTLRYQQLVPRALRRGTIAVTPSQATKDDLVATYGTDPGRIHVTPLGIDPDWFAAVPPSASWLVGEGLPERYLLAVGNLEPRKNLPDLVEAHRRLAAAEPDTPPLVLVGPPGWGEPLRAGPGVVFAGYQRGERLRRLVAGAAVLAFPSRREGFGLPPLEALACGVPVVASDLPVTREVLGDAATFTPVGDVDALAHALHVALAGGTGAGTPTSAARRDRARLFTWDRCARATLVAYTEALTG
jgi:glycosyltransferase involved in cell wall biosynthesis